MFLWLPKASVQHSRATRGWGGENARRKLDTAQGKQATKKPTNAKLYKRQPQREDGCNLSAGLPFSRFCQLHQAEQVARHRSDGKVSEPGWGTWGVACR